MKKRTLEELQKEINGKQVKHVRTAEAELVMDALMIWPPGGEQVSIKPYGYIPEEVLAILIKYDYTEITLEEVSMPEFCLASHNTKDNEYALGKLADLPEGGDYAFYKITGKRSEFEIGLPTCPYG